MEPDELLALVDGYELPHPPEMPMETQHETMPAVGAPNSFAAPPRHGEPQPQGSTVPQEPAALLPDPAIRALQRRHERRQQGHGGAGQGAALGWVADPAGEASRLDAWVDEVEALHQADAAVAALAPDLPDLEALMQEWSLAMQAHIAASPLPDPRQEVDLATYARMCCSMLDLAPPPGASGQAGLAHCLHALFALYLEFRYNPAFQHRHVFVGGGGGGGAAAEQPGLV